MACPLGKLEVSGWRKGSGWASTGPGAPAPEEGLEPRVDDDGLDPRGDDGPQRPTRLSPGRLRSIRTRPRASQMRPKSPRAEAV